MTFRERLADWISGGALSAAYEDRNDAQRYETKNFAAAEQWREAYNELDLALSKTMHDLESSRLGLRQAVGALAQILDATADGKSGTAQKIHRMAKEALGE